MGTILMKASIKDIDVNNLPQYNFNNLERSEINTLCEKAELREAILKINLPPHLQARLHNNKPFTQEEAELVIANSEETWEGLIISHYQFSTEFLHKYAGHVRLNYVELQDAIDPAFVEKWVENMDIGGFIEYRLKNHNDIQRFFHIPEVRDRFLRNRVSYNGTREMVELYMTLTKPDLDVDAMKVLLDRIYDTPVTEELLREVYTREDRRRSHDVGPMVNYFNNHKTKNVYDNWNDYVKCSEQTRSTGVAEVWFRDMHRSDIQKFLGVED